MNFKQMIKKYRPEKNNPAESELLGENHPHCLLVIEGVDKLYRMYREGAK